MSDRNFIADVIYGLKREYGESLVVTNVITTPDRETGDRNETTDTFTIDQAIPLPINLRTQFLSSIGQTNRRQSYMHSGQRQFLIQKSDIPAGKVISETGTRVQFTDAIEQVVQVEDFDYAIVVTSKAAL